MQRTKVKVVVCHESKDVDCCWPCKNYDFSLELSRVMRAVRDKNADVDFDVVATDNANSVKTTYAEDVKIYDGVLVLLFTCWKQVDIFYVENSLNGLPVIVANMPYAGSGGALMLTAPLLRKGNNRAILLSTTNYYEIADAVKLFDVMNKMRQTTVLCVSERADLEIKEGWFTSQWGVKFVNKNGATLMNYFESVNDEDAKVFATKWKKEAIEVVEPTDNDVLLGAKLHLALKKMMHDFNADSVTVDCLSLATSGCYGKYGNLYPCLSHFEMLNDGIVAVCEADIPATVTSLVTKYLANKPGFVSDPIIDTSCNQIIYAHCVSCAKMYGYDDARVCPYAIRSHAEDKAGAAVQVYFPAGEKVTTFIINAKERGACSLHLATTVGNVGYQEACRSKMCATTNAEAVMNNWTGGWHRVTVLGDYSKQLENLFKLSNLAFIREDK